MANHGGSRAFDDSEWQAAIERDEEIRGLDRRLGLLAAEMRSNQEIIVGKLDQILVVVKRDRSDVTDLFKRWENLIDWRLDAEKRLTELEQRPTKRARKK